VNAVPVRGWCPGALRPMESGDGLIVRLRICGGIVPVALAGDIARWSRRYGNGQLDLSSRGNLQLRGISRDRLPELHAALRERDLLDTSAAGEAVRNVIASPLAGLDPNAVLDIRPVTRDLEQCLTSDATLHALPGKFGFAIDDGGSLSLGDVPSDIRFVACRTVDGPAFDIRLAGAASSRLGPCRPNELVQVAGRLARAFLRLRTGQEAGIRRMRDLVAAQGAEAVAREAGLVHVHAPMSERLLDPAAFLGIHTLDSAAFVGMGLPFGRMTAEDFSSVQSAAAANGAREIRLTPWRAILMPVPSIAAVQALSTGLPTGRFIVDPRDPRCRIAACPGAPSCAQGTTPMQSDAAVLMAELAHAPGSGIVLHISGCAKGCSHPRPAALTLVGRNGRYDLIHNGVASDPPALPGLTISQATEHVRHLLNGDTA